MNVQEEEEALFFFFLNKHNFRNAMKWKNETSLQVKQLKNRI